jgi:hypothetical protein
LNVAIYEETTEIVASGTVARKEGDCTYGWPVSRSNRCLASYKLWPEGVGMKLTGKADSATANSKSKSIISGVDKKVQFVNFHK